MPRARGMASSSSSRMHDVLQRHVDSGQLPGLVGVVVRRGEEHVETIGTLAFGSTSPMRRDTVFRLASMTKPITAVATMMLVESCALRLDDPVDEFLPELKDRKVLRAVDANLDDVVPARRAITVRDLLTFRSGYGEAMFVAGDCPMTRALAAARLPLAEWLFDGTPDEFMKRLGALPLMFQPGERWAYHMSAEILGVLVARASGRSLGAFLRERIFEPLGMKDTAFTVPESSLSRLSTCYCTDPATQKTAVMDEPRGLFARPRAFESGAGGLASTTDDVLTFARMLSNEGAHGRERILSRASVKLMTTDTMSAEQKRLPSFFPDFWTSHGWGLGLAVVTHRDVLGASPGSFGWDGAFGTSMWIDPNEGLVGVLTTQRRPDWMQATMPAVVRDFWTAAAQTIEG
jgi:CubicO group peptidase (beta-lactamase class C family)